jgi:hypothetical protein
MQKKESYGFIKKIFLDFINDEKKWSDILREDKQLVDAEKECIYCGRLGRPRLGAHCTEIIIDK